MPDLDMENNAAVPHSKLFFESLGRLRDVQAGPDGFLYVLTSNQDDRPMPAPADPSQRDAFSFTTAYEGGVAVQGTGHLLLYNITGAKLLGIAANATDSSLAVAVSVTEGGSLVLSMPRTVIDANPPKNSRHKNAITGQLTMKPFVLWMTGLPCSGKSTIVRHLQKHIPNLAMLDGDELREWFSPKDFSKAGRDEHNKRVAHLAKLLLKHDVPSVVSLVSPYMENRSSARQIIDAGPAFAECYVKCSLEKCEERDVKGMYARARKGEIKGFTGIDDPYEPPQNPDLLVDTEFDTLEESSAQVVGFLKSRGLI